MVFAVLAISVVAILLVPILLVRVYKRQLAAFHRAITNQILSPFASRLPGFAIVTNVGRRSGKVYRTPVNVFRRPEGFLIALTYGKESGWVKNVLAAGGCELATCRVPYQCSAPIIVHDPKRRRFPLPVRIVLGLINANDFLQLESFHGETAVTAGARDFASDRDEIFSRRGFFRGLRPPRPAGRVRGARLAPLQRRRRLRLLPVPMPPGA